ncbi:MAG: LPS export ABC transporter permease LptF [Thermodesulfobacteriota bacterium]|nr:LPS export ABC transporter permease LptF [Thermodesulfobacteriota bacterium]
MKKIIPIYILKEITTYFLLGLLIFVFLIFTNKILKLTDLVINRGVGALSIIKIFIYLLPFFLTFALPMVLLISVVLTMGRLSIDNELTAIKASGIGLYQLFFPVFLFTVLIYFFTGYLTLFALPKSKDAFNETLLNIARSKINAGLKEKVFNDEFSGLMIYANRVSRYEKQLFNVLISDKRNLDVPILIMAKKGHFVTNPSLSVMNLKLFNGATQTLNKKTGLFREVNFKEYTLSLNLFENMVKGIRSNKKISDLSITELRKRLENEEETITRNQVLLEINKRFSIPFACLIFGLIGIPLGSTFQRSSNILGILISLIVFLIYYILLSFAEAMGKAGYLNPVIGPWIPNLLFLVLGIYLYIKVNTERQIKTLTWLDLKLNRLVYLLKGHNKKTA